MQSGLNKRHVVADCRQIQGEQEGMMRPLAFDMKPAVVIVVVVVVVGVGVAAVAAVVVGAAAAVVVGNAVVAAAAAVVVVGAAALIVVVGAAVVVVAAAECLRMHCAQWGSVLQWALDKGHFVADWSQTQGSR